MLVAVRPDGTASLTDTVALVDPAPLLVTVMVYVAPIWLCAKLPTCVLVIVKSGGVAMIVVGSVAVLLLVLVSPPPDTVAVLVTLAGAFAATFTLKVSEG
jgi:hypothetical protein